MEALLGIIAGLIGAFFWQRNRANTAEARNENLEVKEKLNTIDSQIAKNDGTLSAEEEKQNELKKEIANAAGQIDLGSIVDFLNKRK